MFRKFAVPLAGVLWLACSPDERKEIRTDAAPGAITPGADSGSVVQDSAGLITHPGYAPHTSAEHAAHAGAVSDAQPAATAHAQHAPPRAGAKPEPEHAGHAAAPPLRGAKPDTAHAAHAAAPR